LYRIDAVESVVDPNVLSRLALDGVNVADAADAVNTRDVEKEKLPAGGQPSGENLLPS
jgi:hypothetical protein